MPVADNPTDHFFSRPLPLREDDLLNLNEFTESDAWVKNFRENYIRTRGYQKLRLSQSLSQLNVIAQSLSKADLLDKIKSEKAEAGLEWKQQLFYLCSEYNVANSKHYLTLDKDLNTVAPAEDAERVLQLIQQNLGS